MRQPGSLGRRVLCWGFLVATVAAVAACGHRTAPRPAGTQPAESGRVQVHQQGRMALLSWAGAKPDPGGDEGGERAFEVRVEALPPDCPGCAATERLTRRYRADSKDLHHEGGRFYLPWPLSEDFTLYRFVVVFHSGRVRGQAAAVMLQTIGSLPVEPLRWEPVATPETSQAARDRPDTGIRLLWAPRREQLYRMITPAGVEVERERLFRAGVFRRVPPAPWPWEPLNADPITGTQWITRAPSPGGSPVEYGLRLVDRFGNEGPLGPTVLITPETPHTP